MHKNKLCNNNVAMSSVVCLTVLVEHHAPQVMKVKSFLYIHTHTDGSPTSLSTLPAECY